VKAKYVNISRKQPKTNDKQTITTGWPVTLYCSSQVLECFCVGIELCAIACKKLVQEVQDWPTHVHASFLYKMTCTSALIVCHWH